MRREAGAPASWYCRKRLFQGRRCAASLPLPRPLSSLLPLPRMLISLPMASDLCSGMGWTEGRAIGRNAKEEASSRGAAACLASCLYRLSFLVPHPIIFLLACYAPCRWWPRSWCGGHNGWGWAPRLHLRKRRRSTLNRVGRRKGVGSAQAFRAWWVRGTCWRSSA